MLKNVLVLLLSFTFPVFFVLNNVHAEEVFEAEKFPYEEMQIQVMPEFDYPENWPKGEPSLLIGYYGKVINKSGKDFNGSIEFPLPVKDSNFSVYLIAEFPEENKPEVQRPFKIDKEKGTVSWEPGKPVKADEIYSFVIEYYANPFDTDKANKKFGFDFIPQAVIKKLDVIVYNPLSAKEFTIDPVADTTTKSEYGQELHHYQYTDVKKGKALNYKASYIKEGNESALSIISKMNPPNDENQSGSATEQDPKIAAASENRPIIDAVGASIIGISIIIAGGFMFFGLRGNGNRTSVRKPKKNLKKDTKNSVPEHTATGDEKKKLRSMLLNGKIDQKTYEEKMKKLI
ncbi:MAG TPA: hypothetical protein DCR24_14920 [Bacillus bacterium]|nr:hypothetical protein [Bacillus sp. (in: firmicutes)]